tara:strand:+ start:337 stop:513 length:177 start_codon:yes stop_codon:yes gene_type:complete
MLLKAAIKRRAVIPFIEAYIGGKNLSGGRDVILMLNKIKTTTGITIETIIIRVLYLIP